MDFKSGQLMDGWRLILLTNVDGYTRECLAIRIGKSITGLRIDQVLELRPILDKPPMIVADNGDEFASNAMFCWSHDCGVGLPFIEPGKSTQNASIGNTNG